MSKRPIRVDGSPKESDKGGNSQNDSQDSVLEEWVGCPQVENVGEEGLG